MWGVQGEGLPWAEAQSSEMTWCVQNSGKQLVMLEHRQWLESITLSRVIFVCF